MWKRIQRLVFGVVPSMLGMLGVVAGVAERGRVDVRVGGGKEPAVGGM